MNYFLLSIVWLTSLAAAAPAVHTDFIANGGFEKHASQSEPTDFQLTGGVEYRYLGDANRDLSSWGVALQSDHPSGSVTTTVKNIDAKAGRWFRFSFRGLPQENFSVSDDNLAMTVAFFGEGGKTSYDDKTRVIFDLIQIDRDRITINGVRGKNGAEVWKTYQLDFMLPFPQIDTLKLSVSFANGNARSAKASEFFVDDFRLERIAEPPRATDEKSPVTQPLLITSIENLVPIGGRWFYAAAKDETAVPKKFDHTNADKLVYRDNVYSAPFANNVSAWLRPGNVDHQGNLVSTAKLIEDNVTIEFDSTSMIIHSHGVPNHPTGKYPEVGRGNPNSIQEQNETFYIPLNPKESSSHFVTTENNSNHALKMGPIGIATNGVVFFNPFDMGNTVAVDMMDRCCGHPNQDGLYHYHKYPVCVNTPWEDDGDEHSPLLGWAFDGYPIYGPYESKDVMAKDVSGAMALNGFNMHFDDAHGWHYHVTPGKFPYLIGGFWGTIDSRDDQRPPRGGPGGGRNGPRGVGPPEGFGPPPGQEGR